MKPDSTGPDGDAPEPNRWPEPDWEVDRRWETLKRLDDAYEINALAHYVREGHPYVSAWRSANAVPWIGPGQYVIFLRVDDASALWSIRDELKRRRERGPT